jgi:ferric-dicitrate binding protein FerR (iron transport regulator)
MDDLIERAFGGQATGEELERLSAWRRASPENERHYHATVRLLGAARELRDAVPEYAPPTAAEILARGSASRRGGGRTRRAVWALAAAVVLLAAGIGLPRVLHRAPGAASAQIVTGAKELATVQLRDGSVVRLAPSSRLQLADTDDGREIFLDGRAFFAITKMPGHPFRVRTRLADATVLGTRFELTTGEADLHLVVVEGRVALASDSERVEVNGGEESHVANGLVSRPARLAHPDSLANWVGKFLAFDSTPLRQVAKEIEAVYGTRIVIGDSTLAARTVTATFTDRSLPQVLSVICSTIGARYELRDGVAVLSGA